MDKQQLTTFKLLFTAVISITIWGMLIWQFNHEGVPSHYLFQNPELPELSNWWGGLILPALSWFTLSRIQKTLLSLPNEHAAQHAKKVAIQFIIALAYGAMLSYAFVHGYKSFTSVMFPAILAFALFFKVYKEEFILGFVLSMSITFGAILPMMFGIIIAVASFIVHAIAQFIWRGVKSLTTKKQLN